MCERDASGEETESDNEIGWTAGWKEAGFNHLNYLPFILNSLLC